MTPAQFVNPFKPAVDTYKRDINPLQHAVEQYAYYLHKKTGQPLETATAFVRSSLKSDGVFAFKDKPMSYLVRGDNGDRARTDGGVMEYIHDCLRQKDILSPSFTAYVSTEKELSVLSEFADENIVLRALAKKAAFAEKAKGNAFKAQLKVLEQANRKIFNNSLSGAHCSVSTALYNKTAHASLTSTCRITSSYGNANNEKILSGNRHYHTYEVTLNNITSIIANTDYPALAGLVEKYRLRIPSAQECLELIRYSSQVYWTEAGNYHKLYSYLITLNDLERASFAYTADFYHLRQFNPELVREILGELTQKVVGTMEDPLAYMKGCNGEVINLVHQICTTEMQGRGHDYTTIAGTQDLQTVACTARHVMEVVTRYGDLFAFIFASKNIPSDIGRFPSVLRRAVITSDTDSTIFTVQEWIHWFYGSYAINEHSISLQAAMTFLAASSIIHVLALVSINMGVDKKNIYRIEMKSEFRFDVFVPTQIGKTYYATIGCQEGNIYKDREYEIKGVQLKSSNIPKRINEVGRELIMQITSQLCAGDKTLSGTYFLSRVAQMEYDIEHSIRSGEVDYMRSGAVKDAASYTAPPMQSPYQNHVFWNTVFGQRYGTMPEPPYAMNKISLKLNNATELKRWFDSIQDESIKTRLIEYFAQRGRSEFTTFNVPTPILKNGGLPKEIQNVIDYRKVAKELCKNLYLILETLGYYFKTDELVRDLYPHLVKTRA